MTSRRSSRLRTGAVAATLAVGAGLLAACGGSGGAGGSASDDTITIGSIHALTGAYAVLGSQIQDGIDAAVKAVNADGGVNGKTIKVISLDDQSAATNAAQSVTQLVQKYRVSAILGPEESTAIGAAAPVASSLGIPMMSGSIAWPQNLTDDQTKWVWTSSPNSSDMVERYISYFEKNGIKRVSIIGNGTPFSTALGTYLDSKSGSLPFEVVASEQIVPGAQDVTPQVLGALEARPDFVLSWMSGADQINVVKTYNRLGPDVPLGLNGGASGSAFREAVGDAGLDGVFAIAYPTQVLDQMPPSFTSAAEAQAYLDGMKKAGKDTDGGASNAVLGWDNVMSLVEALKRAESTEPDGIKDALDTQTFVGALTTWKRSADDHAGDQPGGYTLVSSRGDTWSLELAAE